MSSLGLSFGCVRALPSNVRAAWGARLIWPNDLVWDRQDIAGELDDRKALSAWLNTGALAIALGLGRLGDLGSDEDRTVTLYEDDRGVIVGNPQGSYGYLYVAAWLKEHVCTG